MAVRGMLLVMGVTAAVDAVAIAVAVAVAVAIDTMRCYA